MVLAQHATWGILKGTNFVGFHPTMVLAQLKDKEGNKLAYFVFPSHYGSRSTDQRDPVGPNRLRVSIPLWFSLNPSVVGKTIEVE